MTESTALAIPERSVEEVIAQVTKIQTLMEKVMKQDEHYGVIPGTQKPTLLKAGAEKLCFLFRLDPQYETTETHDEPHLNITSRCTLWHIGSGLRMGSGMGSCSTKETKYAFRHAARKCPSCGKEAIIKGKEEYGGGWLCFKKKDGCGAKFKEGDAAIETQEVGQVANENLADVYNTVLKMSNKRALVAAVLNVTAASDIFTQDLEDYAVIETSRPEAMPADNGAGASVPESGPRREEERNILLGKIKGIADKKKLTASVRADLWRVHCPGATPENVAPEQLQDLYAHLQKVPGQA